MIAFVQCSRTHGGRLFTQRPCQLDHLFQCRSTAVQDRILRTVLISALQHSNDLICLCKPVFNSSLICRHFFLVQILGVLKHFKVACNRGNIILDRLLLSGSYSTAYIHITHMLCRLICSNPVGLYRVIRRNRSVHAGIQIIIRLSQLQNGKNRDYDR